MNRSEMLQRLYNKKKLYKGFDYDALWHPPISAYMGFDDVKRLNQIALSAKLNGRPHEKYYMMDEIVRPRGFTRFHAGTNRLVYKSEYDDTFLLKIGIDRVGITDNPSEFYAQNMLRPFCDKIFDVTSCGTVALVERGDPIRNRQQFEEFAEEIFYIIVTEFRGLVLEDIGTNFFMNWAIRKNFGPMLIDFPYTYAMDINKMHCTEVDKVTGLKCPGLIDYDTGFNTLICELCGARYTARELAKSNQVISAKSVLDRTKELGTMEKIIVYVTRNGVKYPCNMADDSIIKSASRHRKDKRTEGKYDNFVQEINAKGEELLHVEGVGTLKRIDDPAPSINEVAETAPSNINLNNPEKETVDKDIIGEVKVDIPEVINIEPTEDIEEEAKEEAVELSAKARMKREDIEDQVNAIEDEFCNKYSDKYNENQLITFRDDLIKYATEHVVKKFEVDEASAERIVREMVEEDFPLSITQPPYKPQEEEIVEEEPNKYEKLAEELGIEEEAPQKRSKRRIEEDF